MRYATAIVTGMLVLVDFNTFSNAQQTPAPVPAAGSTAATSSTDQPDKPPLKPEELEQLLASIALYPDSLITQVLMASTYPLEIVQADRWAKGHKDLKGDALAKELEKLPYDASVKSLVNFPQVLAMMSEKIDLTVKIGDAFIEQQADVMNTIQKLRNKANANGNLKSNEQQKVTVVQAPPTTPDTTVIVQQAPPAQIITIEPTQPNVIYVPTYNPTVVYGAWPYPYYPPAPYYPPNYVASNVMSFGLGVACGAAWGYAWGNSNWGGNDVDIDVNRNANFNTNIDRSKAQANIDARRSDRQTNRSANGGAANRGSGSRNSWQHDSGHRGGVPYRDQKTSSQFGRGNAQASQAREQFRGRSDAGRQELGRGGADSARGAGGPGAGVGAGRGNTAQSPARGNTGAGNGTGAGNAAGAGANRSPNSSGANRGASPSGSRDSSSSSSRGGAFSGAGGGGSSSRAASQRGQSSRSGGASRGSGSRGGGRGGGGRGRSDVNLKTEFVAVDPQVTLEKVAALPITTWVYKDDLTSRHLGPMAQNFYHTFGIGTDDKTITFLDEGGVALSAIQGLNQKIDEKDARIQALERELAELKTLVQKLADKPSPGAVADDPAKLAGARP